MCWTCGSWSQPDSCGTRSSAVLSRTTLIGLLVFIMVRGLAEAEPFDLLLLLCVVLASKTGRRFTNPSGKSPGKTDCEPDSFRHFLLNYTTFRSFIIAIQFSHVLSLSECDSTMSHSITYDTHFDFLTKRSMNRWIRIERNCTRACL